MNSEESELIRSLLTSSEGEAFKQLTALNARLGAQSDFQFIGRSTRENIVKLVEESQGKSSLVAPLLELIKFSLVTRGNWMCCFPKLFVFSSWVQVDL